MCVFWWTFSSLTSVKEAVFCNTDLAYLPCHLHPPPLRILWEGGGSFEDRVHSFLVLLAFHVGSTDQEHPCSPQTIDKGKKAGDFWKIKKSPQTQIWSRKTRTCPGKPGRMVTLRYPMHSLKTKRSKCGRWCKNNARRFEHLENKNREWKNSQTYYRKNTSAKNLPYCGFPQVITYPRTEGFAVTIQNRVIKTSKLWESLFTSGCDQQMQKMW